MNNSPIGLMDSGVGGLTVWQEIVRQLPHESTVYIADSKNTPYGGKSSEEIFQLARKMVDFLIWKDVKIIVVACNTITVSCIDRLREAYPGVPIIGTVPVIKTAAEVTKNRKIGVFSTTRTAESLYQKELIQKYAGNCEVFSIGSDELVPLIEQGEISGQRIRSILEKVCTSFTDNHIDALAVACTHFPFIKKEIQGVLGPGVQLLEPSEAVARHTKRILSQNNALSKGNDFSYTFYTTGDGQVLQKLIGLLRVHIEAVQIMPLSL